MKLTTLMIAGSVAALTFTSCVSKKAMKAEKDRYILVETERDALKLNLLDCNTQVANEQRKNALLENDIASLQKQIDFLKENNNQALKQLENLSVISGAQAESIKKSLENIGAKDAYIQDLQSAISRKDSINLALVTNLKGAIGNMDDQDINIKVDKGVVYIDISDKLLFQSGKWEVTARAKEVLGKVAKVLKNQPDIEFMVEGHTDNVPYNGAGQIVDNWDLSVKRATTVVRLLQNDYGIPPSRMAAAGRGEYIPVASNDNAAGKAANRRTRIVILPQLDQFFKLLETK